MSINQTTNTLDFRSAGATAEKSSFASTAPTTPGLNSGDITYVTPTGAVSTTPGSVYRYDGTTNKQYKYPGSSGNPVYPELQPVLDYITTPPTTPRDQDSYLVKATATGAWAGKEGQLATWSDYDGAWVFYTPANGDKTTLTSSGATVGTGTYQYDSGTNTWILVQAGINVDPPADVPVSGNFAFPTEYKTSGSSNSAHLVIVGDRLATWGVSSTNGNNGGDLTNTSALPHRISYAWTNLVDGTYSPYATYHPKFVDAAFNDSAMLAIDHTGKVWAMGVYVIGTGITTTPNGNTAVSRVPAYCLVPIPFFHANNIQAYQVGMSYYVSQNPAGGGIQSSYVISVTGDLYMTGTNQWGQLGDGTTTTRNNWYKWAGIDPVKKVQITDRNTFVLTTTGKLYMAGTDGNTANLTGLGQKLTPTLVTSSVADFDTAFSYNIVVVKTDGTLWIGGANAGGQQGRGNTTATTLSAVPGITNAKTPIGGYYNRSSLGYVGTDNKLYFSGTNYMGQMGIAATAANTNRLTFAAADVGAVFQGAVKKARIGNTIAVVMDSAGSIYTCGNLRSRGVGNTDFNTLTTDMNRWTKVPLPAAATDFRQVDNNEDMVFALCGAHGVYQWGFNTSNSCGWTLSQGNFASPTYVPLAKLDTGIAVSPAPEYVADKTGSITGMTFVSATDIVDGMNGQTVTVKLNVTGTTGKVDLTGLQISGADTTQVSSNTSYVFVTNASGTEITLSFTIDAADVPGLVVPNTQAQPWTVTFGSVSASGNGLRITDAIIGALSAAGATTDLAAYNAATSGQIVEVSAAAYTALQTLSGAGKYGAADSSMALCVSSWGGGGRVAAVGGGSSTTAVGTFIPANNYPFAFSLMMNNLPVGSGGATPAAAGTVQFGYYGASGGATANWTPQVLMGTNSTPFNAAGATGQRRYFLMKGANSQTTQQSAVYVGNSSSGSFLGGYNLAVSLNFCRQNTPVTVDPLLTTAAYSWMLGVQCLATPTKQWA